MSGPATARIDAIYAELALLHHPTPGIAQLGLSLRAILQYLDELATTASQPSPADTKEKH